MKITDSPAVYEWTGPTGVKFRDVREPSGTYYHDTTPRPVINALESARDLGAKVRLFLGDRKTGKGWNEENDCCGIIGRSMGPIKIPLLIRSARSHGGPAILVDCIVCLFVNGREVYRHPGFKFPKIIIRYENKYKDCPWCADVNGDKAHARFKTELAAKRWSAFMRGERMCK